MHSRLHILCNKVIEAGWLVAVAVTPLHFVSTSSRIFEPNKMTVLRSIALVIVAAWVVQAVERWFSRADQRPLQIQPVLLRNGIVLSALLVLIVTALATVFSVLPHLSIWGSFDRSAGLYTTAAYLVFFLAILVHLRTPAQLQRLITTLLLVSLPLALYGLIQQLGVDPISWVEATDGRSRSTLGYPAALGAMLVLTIPLTLLRVVEARRRRQYMLLVAYLLLLGLQVAVLIFTRSRGPLLGLIIGLFFGGFIWALLHQWRRSILTLIGGSLVLVACLVVINLPNSPLNFVQDVPFLDRLTRLSDPKGSTVGRVLIWTGSTNLMVENPEHLLIGYGPETIRFVLYPQYTGALGQLHGWQKFVDRTHSEMLDVLVTTGLLGVLCYLLLITSLVYYGLQWLGLLTTPRQRLLFLGCWSSGGLLALGMARWIGQTWAFSSVALTFGLLAGLFGYLAFFFFKPSEQPTPSEPPLQPRYAALIIGLVVGLLAHFVETNVGIAFSTTNLIFWIYAALLVVIGVFFLRPSSEKMSEEQTQNLPPERSSRENPTSIPLPDHTRPNTQVLAFLVGLLLLPLAYSFGAFLDSSSSVQALLGGTWLLAGSLLFFGGRIEGTSRLRETGIYVGLSLLPMVLFLWLSHVLFQRATSQLVLFYGIVFSTLGGLAYALYRSHQPRTRTALSPWSLVVAALVILGTGWTIYHANLQPLMAGFYHQEARRAYQQRNYDLAATSYWHALNLVPKQDQYRLEYAQLLAAKAHYRASDATERHQLFEEAERILQTAAADNPYEQYHLAGLGEVYRLWAKSTPDADQRRARYEQAAAAYEKALAINQENVLIWKQIANLYDEMGNTAQTRRAFEQIITWDSGNTGIWQRLASIYQADNDLPKAIHAYEMILRQRNQPQPALHHTLATLYQQNGQLEDATQAAEQAVALGASVLAYQQTLIALYQQQGQCRAALQRTETALQQWPTQPDLRTRQQSLLQQCGGETGGD